MPSIDDYTDEEIKSLATNAESMSDLIRQLRLNIGGGTYPKVLKRVLSLGIDPRNRGLRAGKKPWIDSDLRYSTADIIAGKCPSMGTRHVKKRLIKEGYLKYECCQCGLLDQWNGRSITLELDHIDGDRWNHRMENLRLLCPNCHSQTSTFRGRNKSRLPGEMANAANLKFVTERYEGSTPSEDTNE